MGDSGSTLNPPFCYLIYYEQWGDIISLRRYKAKKGISPGMPGNMPLNYLAIDKVMVRLKVPYGMVMLIRPIELPLVDVKVRLQKLTVTAPPSTDTYTLPEVGDHGGVVVVVIVALA